MPKVITSLLLSVLLLQFSHISVAVVLAPQTYDGYIDGFFNSSTTLKGWACAVDVVHPVKVELSFGSISVVVKADQPSNDRTVKVCGSGSRHNFSYTLTPAQKRQSAGQPVIAKFVGTGKLLRESGTFRVPEELNHKSVAGQIIVNKAKVSGYACIIGQSTPAFVEFRLGNLNGNYLLVKADRQSAISGRACASGSIMHGFEFQIAEQHKEWYGGMKIYAKIPGAEQKHQLLDNSGDYRVPLPSSPVPPKEPRGYVDFNTGFGGFGPSPPPKREYIAGYACFKGQNTPVTVELRQDSTSGRLIKRLIAEERRGFEERNRDCGTTYVYHDFAFKLEPSHLQALEGKRVYAVIAGHGFKLENSGVLIPGKTPPPPPPKEPAGSISLNTGSGKPDTSSSSKEEYIAGYACFKGQNAAVTVELRQGSVRGAIIDRLPANEMRHFEGGHCGTSHSSHDFAFKLNTPRWQALEGKKIYATIEGHGFELPGSGIVIPQWDFPEPKVVPPEDVVSLGDTIPIKWESEGESCEIKGDISAKGLPASGTRTFKMRKLGKVSAQVICYFRGRSNAYSADWQVLSKGAVPDNLVHLYDTLERLEGKDDYNTPLSRLDLNAEVERIANWPKDRVNQEYLPLDGNKRIRFNGNTGREVSIYFVDTGIDGKIPEFQGRDGGVEFYNAVSDEYDNSGPLASRCEPVEEGAFQHGTAVASLAAGRTLGLAPEAWVLSVMSMGCSGKPDPESIKRGLQAILENIKDVEEEESDVHLRGGLPAIVNIGQNTAEEEVGPLPFQDEIDALIEAGAIVVQSAGNRGVDAIEQIGSDTAIIVGATAFVDEEEEEDTRAIFDNDPANHSSNFGDEVDVFAPGHRIITANTTASLAYYDYRGKVQYPYLLWNGDTSFAAPIVTGAIALYLQSYPEDVLPTEFASKQEAVLAWLQQPNDLDAGAASAAEIVDGRSPNASLLFVNGNGFAMTPTIEGVWRNNQFDGRDRKNVSWHYAMGYHFTPKTDGVIEKLGGFFNGSKQVKLFDKATGELLAEATVVGNNYWSYADIEPVAVKADSEYTVAVYLAGRGGSFRACALRTGCYPVETEHVTINSSAFISTRNDAEAVPVYTSASRYMYGQADIWFTPDQ